jgi:RHS repeat-associated protein
VFAYDTELRLISVTGPTGLVWRYERDPAGRLVGEIDFNGRRLGYLLDPAGRLAERVNGAGQRARYRRDALGRVVEARDDSGAVSAYAYDPAGNLVWARNADAIVAYERDPSGRVLSETVNGARTGNAYDLCGRRVRRTTPTGAVSTWTYDAAGRAAELLTAGGRLAFGYDAAGHEINRRVGSVALLTWNFDAADRVTTLGVWTGDTRLRQRSYTYRPDGNLTAVDDPRAGTRRIDLDPRGRVTGVHATDWSERYAYDALGNLTDAEWPSPDDATQGRRDYTGTLVRTAGRTHYEYDAQGRVVRKRQHLLTGGWREWTFTWDADDRLTEAVTPDGSRWRYRYDALGRRIAKQRLTDSGDVAEQTTFTWDDARLAEQVHSAPEASAEATTWDYQPDTHLPLTQLRRQSDDLTQDQVDAVFHAIVTDLVGAPTELVTAEGQIAWHTATSLWGAIVADPDAGTDCPLRFPGQYHDPETGLDYNLNRYYDPEIGRYLSADPLGLPPAPDDYAYVPNPTGWIDPLGLEAYEVFYRGMSRAEFEGQLKTKGTLYPRNGESFVTQDLDYIRQLAARNPNEYEVLVRFEMAPGTRDALMAAGVRDEQLSHAARRMGLEDLPTFVKGQRLPGAVHVKTELDYLTFGLRRGSVDIFNSRIQSYEEIGWGP